MADRDVYQDLILNILAKDGVIPDSANLKTKAGASINQPEFLGGAF